VRAHISEGLAIVGDFFPLRLRHGGALVVELNERNRGGRKTIC
jgi:hypothetical protein